MRKVFSVFLQVIVPVSAFIFWAGHFEKNILNVFFLLFLYVLAYFLCCVFFPQIKMNTRILLTTGVVAGLGGSLILGTFYTPHETYDGAYFHTKVINSVIANGKYEPLFETTKPYPVEYLMGFIGKFSGYAVINFVYAATGIISILLTFKLLQKLGTKESAALFLSGVLFTSPVFFNLAFSDYKVDIFLYLVTVSSYLIFLKMMEENKYKIMPLLGLFLGLGVLIKIGFAPIAAVIGTITFYEFVFVQKQKNLILPISLLVFTILPVVLWGCYFGIKIPLFQKTIAQKHQEVLRVNPTVTDACYTDLKVYDLATYSKETRFPAYLLQPLYYLAGNNMDPVGFQANNTLSSFLYIGVFFSLLWPLTKEYSNKKNLYVFLIYVTYLLSFLFTVGAIYWYLLPVLPLSLFFFYRVLAASVSKAALKRIILVVAVDSILLLTVVLLNYRQDIEINKDEDKKNREFSKYLQENTEGLILDTSFLQTPVMYPYFTDSQNRIVKTDFIFADTSLDNKNIYTILEKENINYLITNMEVSVKYPQGECLARYKEGLKNFLNTYTDTVYEDDRGYVVSKLK
ncbi:MAG: hypothetical protein UU64_C0004G0046 [candidate division WWE3 bacterium GW2011_GWF2_41_45]|uniref:Glycosyltransferase RgtA/B/C/D-like domain-containing protein n=3 Tax=Katanobacteria TaxID=422282 RepID=A0A1F4W0U2_UNCKA|nr:MAG: hypothetical protein UU55_C0007G0032 [candidate division WWE3 bacterium GW2011_GWC2_41_23]KKS10449.1 MAG: hypothetical protein UU64_C0004G0046 [candidate division WWE3 bacterium GW2011_GWF2_41_45]KKS19767.1 MAG: hypothetical protein UU79_C0010G0012 [candidate division WWE3 bacterium GW2011_GWE1_41_72]KKS29949.1 MAG: hypothetical protein UU90_C0006G0014 [candidate division WWE3 bacterium GW2011_GWD2_42_11]KKS50710.1 MAG: hypothetical protein UV16_C0007G0078 [candidate division WWE3 bacte